MQLVQSMLSAVCQKAASLLSAVVSGTLHFLAGQPMHVNWETVASYGRLAVALWSFLQDKIQTGLQFLK